MVAWLVSLEGVSRACFSLTRLCQRRSFALISEGSAEGRAEEGMLSALLGLGEDTASGAGDAIVAVVVDSETGLKTRLTAVDELG